MVKRNAIFLICALVIVSICFYFAIVPMISTGKATQNNQAISYPSYNAPFGKLILATNLSNTPQNMTLYRVTPRDTDMIRYFNPNLANSEGNLTSETEAIPVALKILDKYGGFPEGAQLINVNTETHYTSVRYERTLDGLPVVGGYLSVNIGKNGELSDLYKVWRTVTPVGQVQVIPQSEALRKIQRGEILSPVLKCDCDVTVNSVRLGYLEKGYQVPQEYLEPIWIFSGSGYEYQVSALDSSESTEFPSSSYAQSNAGLYLNNPQDSPPSSAEVNGAGPLIIAPFKGVSSSANVSEKTGNTSG